MAKLLPALEVTVLALSPPQKVHPPENLQLQQRCYLHWTCLSHPSFFHHRPVWHGPCIRLQSVVCPGGEFPELLTISLLAAFTLTSVSYSHAWTTILVRVCQPWAISQATARALIAPQHSSSLKSAREPVASSTMPFLAPPGNATHYAPVGTILNPFLTDQKCIILTPEQDLSNNHCILGSSSHCILLSPSGSSCKISRPPSQRHWRPAHPLYIPLGN